MNNPRGSAKGIMAMMYAIAASMQRLPSVPMYGGSASSGTRGAFGQPKRYSSDPRRTDRFYRLHAGKV